jgi:hypothetical protein
VLFAFHKREQDVQPIALERKKCLRCLSRHRLVRILINIE